LVDGIQSLFQSLNIEVQDVSPDVLKALFVGLAAEDAFTLFKNKPSLFSPLVIMVITTKKWSKT
jgi:hypothetical protein